jgi:hypothetical protein
MCWGCVARVCKASCQAAYKAKGLVAKQAFFMGKAACLLHNARLPVVLNAQFES